MTDPTTLDRVFPPEQCEDPDQPFAGSGYGGYDGRRGSTGQRFVGGWLGVAPLEAGPMPRAWHDRFDRACGWLISEYETGGPSDDDGAA